MSRNFPTLKFLRNATKSKTFSSENSPASLRSRAYQPTQRTQIAIKSTPKARSTRKNHFNLSRKIYRQSRVETKENKTVKKASTKCALPSRKTPPYACASNYFITQIFLLSIKFPTSHDFCMQAGGVWMSFSFFSLSSR